MRLLLSSSLVLISLSPAHAHLGHLGDLAGHSHWLGLGAVVVAGVVGSLLGKRGDDEAASDEDATDEHEAETEGAAA